MVDAATIATGAGADNLPRWSKLDSRFMLRSTTRALLDTFGPSGPLLFLAIIGEVEGSPTGRITDTIEVPYGPMARAVGCDPREVSRILSALADLGQVQLTGVGPGPMSTASRSMIVRLLNRPRWAPEAQREPRSASQPRYRAPQLRRGPSDDRLVAALWSSGRPMRGQEVATLLNMTCGGSFKARLARLAREGQITKGPGGYGVPKAG